MVFLPLTHNHFASLEEFIRMDVPKGKPAQERNESPTDPLEAFQRLHSLRTLRHARGEEREKN